jgi:chromosome segregation ATPase
MDNETFQKLIGHFVELKDKIDNVKSDLKTNINDVKTDIRAVAIGQVDLKTQLKNDISAVTEEIIAVKNDISDVKDNISALETNINAGQEELRREISDFQERIRNIEARQAEFEERVTRNLREDLSRNIEAGQAEFEERVTRSIREDLSRNIQAIRQDFETQLAALKFEAAKAAAWITARLQEATREPTERPPTPPECRRSEQPACWWCGQPGHIQKYCRQRPPEEMGQDPRTRKGVSDSPIKPPRYAVKVLAEWAKGSLIADGWV